MPEPDPLNPFDEESEKVTLGELAYAESVGRHDEAREVVGLLSPNDFYVEPHRHIFHVLSQMHEDGQEPTYYAVMKALEGCGGIQKEVWQTHVDRVMLDYCVTSANLLLAARVVAAKARDRRALACLDAARAAALNGTGFDANAADLLLRGIQALDAPKPADLCFRTVAEMRAHQTPEVEWFIKGFVGAGLVTLMGGPFKGGKSFIASAIVRAMETGSEFCGFSGKRSLSVVASEEGISGLVDKGEKFGIEFAKYLSREEFDASLTFAQYLAACVDEAKRLEARTIWIDTFRRFARLGTDKTKDDGAVQEVMDQALSIAAQGFAVILLVHHRKGAQEVEDGEAIAGSYALGASADIIVEVRRFKEDKRSPYRVLSCMGRFDEIPKDEVVVELHEESKPFYYTASGAVSDLKATLIEGKVLAFIDEWFARESGPTPRTAILEGVKGKAEDIGKTLNSMTYKRLLCKCQKGRAHFFYKAGAWAVVEPYTVA